MTKITNSLLLLLWFAILQFSEYPIYFGNLDLPARSLPLPNLKERSCKSLDCFSNHMTTTWQQRENILKRKISISEYVFINNQNPLAKVNEVSFSKQLSWKVLWLFSLWPKSVFCSPTIRMSSTFIYSETKRSCIFLFFGTSCENNMLLKIFNTLWILPDVSELEVNFRSYTSFIFQ